MATVTASVILQAKSTLPSDGYPSASVGSNGWDTVTCTPGDTVSVSVRSGNADLGGGPGTINFGFAPSGNTGTGGTFFGGATFSSNENPTTVTVTGVAQTGYINIWCGPSQDGSSVGWRARIYVTANHTSSISTNKSTYADGETVTVNWSTTYSGTKYYNSTGTTGVNNRFSPKEGSVGSGSSGSFNTTAVGPSTGSWTGGFSLRTGSIAGTVIANSNTVTINAPAPVVTAPTDISFSAATTASATTNVTVTASGGTNGTMQVSTNGSTWVANGTAFSRTRGTSQTWYARTVGTTTSGNYTESYTVPYLTSFDNNITIGSYTSTISSSSTSNVSVPYTNGGTNDQYRIRSNNTVGGSWLDTRNGSSNTFIVEYTSTSYTGTELPSTGQTFTYFIEGRRRADTGGDPNGTWNAVALSNYGSNTFTITRSVVISGPNSFSFNNVTGALNSATVQASTTLSGISGGTVSASVSSSNSTGQISTDGTTWATSLTGVTNGTIYVRLVASPNYSTAVTAAVVVNGVSSGNWSVTTAASGSGGGTPPPVGTSNYGLKILGANGSSTVFSPEHRFANTAGQRSVVLFGGEVSSNFPVPGATSTSDYFIVILEDSNGVAQIEKFNTYYRIRNISNNTTEPSVTIALAVLIG